jgi:hypothetical protein
MSDKSLYSTSDNVRHDVILWQPQNKEQRPEGIFARLSLRGERNHEKSQKGDILWLEKEAERGLRSVAGAEVIRDGVVAREHRGAFWAALVRLSWAVDL